MHVFVQHRPSYGGDNMNITYKFNSDLQIRTAPPRLTMVQGDSHSRVVEMTVTSGGEAWVPENIDNVMLRYQKSDGTGGSYDTTPDGIKAWALEENRLRIAIAPQMLTVPRLVHTWMVLISRKINKEISQRIRPVPQIRTVIAFLAYQLPCSTIGLWKEINSCFYTTNGL